MHITHTTLTMIENIYTKSKQPNELISGILNIYISDHLLCISFIGTQMRTNKAPTSSSVVPFLVGHISNIPAGAEEDV